MHDFDVDIVDFLERLGIRNIQPGEEEVPFSCPFSGHLHGDEKPSASFNTVKGVWHCHGCKRRGNVVTFLAEYENITPMKAARYLREFYGQGFRMPDGGSIAYELEKFWEDDRKVRSPNPEIPEKLADDRSIDWHVVEEAGEDAPLRLRYMLERGFSPDTLSDWKVGFDTIGDRISIPVRNPAGKLIGFKGRAWNPIMKPKYLVLGDKHGGRYGFSTYEKGMVVFGLDRAWKREKAPVVLTEGELDVIMLAQYGFRAFSCEGSYISDYQEVLIRGWAEELVLFFDDDEAGHGATAEAISRFQKYMPVRIVDSHEGDPASLGRDAVSELIGSSTSSVELLIA